MRNIRETNSLPLIVATFFCLGLVEIPAIKSLGGDVAKAARRWMWSQVKQRFSLTKLGVATPLIFDCAIAGHSEGSAMAAIHGAKRGSLGMGPSMLEFSVLLLTKGERSRSL